MDEEQKTELLIRIDERTRAIQEQLQGVNARTVTHDTRIRELENKLTETQSQTRMVAAIVGAVSSAFTAAIVAALMRLIVH